MSIRKRQGNRPERRVAPIGHIAQDTINDLLSRISYIGSANHKLKPGDYQFVPSHSPRPSKSPCDDIRSILLEEARDLFKQGIKRGMVSEFTASTVPKYVWSIDVNEEIYEAKTNPKHETKYHGYRINDDDIYIRKYILAEWKKRV